MTRHASRRSGMPKSTSSICSRDGARVDAAPVRRLPHVGDGAASPRGADLSITIRLALVDTKATRALRSTAVVVDLRSHRVAAAVRPPEEYGEADRRRDRAPGRRLPDQVTVQYSVLHGCSQSAFALARDARSPAALAADARAEPSGLGGALLPQKHSAQKASDNVVTVRASAATSSCSTVTSRSQPSSASPRASNAAAAFPAAARSRLDASDRLRPETLKARAVQRRLRRLDVDVVAFGEAGRHGGAATPPWRSSVSCISNHDVMKLAAPRRRRPWARGAPSRRWSPSRAGA